MSGEDCLLHFPWWKIHLGGVVTNVLCGKALYQLLRKKEGSGGPLPVASQSHCVGGQYLTSYMSL